MRNEGVFFHEGHPVGVAQDGAGAAHGLGDEERGRLLGVVEGGRVELDELHAAHDPFGAIDHRHAVAGGHHRVGGVLIDHAEAAGGHHRHLREDGVDLLGLGVIDVRPVAGDVGRAAVHLHAEVVLGDDLHRQTVLVNFDVRVLPRGHDQLLLDLIAGDVLVVQDAVHGVAALLAEGETAVLVLVEIDPPLHQFHHPLGGLADGQLHNVAVREFVTGHHRVLDMLFVGVGFVNHGGDAALRVTGGTVVHLRFRHQADLAEIGGLQREAEPRDSRSDNQKVNFFAHNLTKL